MNDVRYATYLYQFRQAVRDTPTIHGHIYLKTDVGTCWERIQKRNRDGEAEITRDYLNDLHAQHEKWLGNGGAHILVLDGSVDYINDAEAQKDLIRKVRTFMLFLVPNTNFPVEPYE